MSKTYRPRISRSQRDAIIEAAEELNGAEVSTFSDALSLLTKYLNVLNDTVECPECGNSELWNRMDGYNGWTQLPEGKWNCPDCEQIFDVWDYLDVDGTKRASLPPLSEDIQYRFECNHEEHNSGTDSQENTQHGVNQEPLEERTGNERWQDRF